MHFNSRRTPLLAIMMLATGLFSQATLAHSEPEKARFVAENGVDQGLCNNRFRPCKSIMYAVQQANKGDKILVAQGHYKMSSATELAYLASQMQPVLGGFSTIDNYQVQQPSQFSTVLEGVPAEYAAELRDKGFDVIVDRKRIDQEKTQLGLEAIERMTTAHSADQCVNGQAAGFACQDMSLLAHIPTTDMQSSSSSSNDIWGHVDLNTMREYAIVGMQRGIAFVEVTDPENPIVVDVVTGSRSGWRDIKVYQYYSNSDRRWKAYAYAIAERDAREGLTIVDLTTLPNSVSLVDRLDIDEYSHNVYISGVDYTTNTTLPGRSPLLHVVGSENFGGSWRTFELKNPIIPSASYSLAGANGSNYTHDASSVLINDNRANSSCVNAQNSVCNVIIDFNENELILWDHTNSTDATLLGRSSYPNASYTHSGWWSEDKQYVILHDETDEQNFGINTTVHFFDISNLNSPTLVSSWVGPTRAIDHNGYTRGNRYYMSNYERGITVLDISDPLAPSQAAYFDTYNPSNNASFNGTWGVYPYLPSGTIIASDLNGGLFVLRDDSVSASDNGVEFASRLVNGAEGSTLEIEVRKQGSGSMSVDYSILPGSARTGDYDGDDGTLTWANGDTASKTISVELTTDTLEESNEMFFVRLSNVSGGEILTNIVAFATIDAGNVARGVVGFSQDNLSVREIDGTVTVDVNRNGGSDEAISVDYSVQSDSATIGDDVTIANGTLNWSNGDDSAQTISFDLVDDSDSEQNESFTITLSSSNTSLLSDTTALTVTIRDDESNQSPTANAGNDIQVNTRQTVNLAGSASDPEGADVTASWTQTAGTNVTLNNADTLSPSFTAPNAAGSLTFELVVADDFGVESTDTLTVTVNEPATVTPTPNTGSGGGGSLHWLTLGVIAMTLARRCRKTNNVKRAA